MLWVSACCRNERGKRQVLSPGSEGGRLDLGGAAQAPPKEATVDKSIEQMGRDLAFGEYSKSTRQQYIKTAEALASHFGRPVAEIERDELRAYVEHLRGQGRSASWMKMRLAALVFLYTKTLGRPTDMSFVVWPRQYSPLPSVLSQAEVAAFLEALRHPVYLAIAMVLYGTGLRIDEALSLEVSDVDGARGVLRVRHGKGNRARQVGLSPALYQWLRSHWSKERPPFAARQKWATSACEKWSGLGSAISTPIASAPLG
jgi:site-specific recombinase XerD